MNGLIINSDNLQIDDIDEFNDKARVILTDDNNNVLIANYGNVIMFPGGTIDLSKENMINGLIRELYEETGILYYEEDFSYIMCLEHYQKKYPKRDGTFSNRLIRNYYYSAKYRGVLEQSQSLTNKEIKDNFRLSLVPIDKLVKLVKNNINSNPRNIYFQEELLSVLSIYEISRVKSTETSLPKKYIKI